MRLAAAALLLVARTAVASPPTQPIANRSYELDLYEGFALGSTEIVAMGGAGVANAIGSSGTLINPSAPAVRQTTDHDWWSWDYHLDYLDGSLSNDYDNAQLGGITVAARVLTLGVSGRVHDWAAAITGTAQYEDLPGNLRPEELHLRFAVARWIPELDLAIGADVSVGQFDLIDTAPAPNQTLFTISGAGLEAGAQWLPSMQDLRLGASVATSEHGNNVTVSSCDPESCTDAGFILPEEVFVPWRLAAGAAYRWADTPWNQIVPARFRDEHAVTVVADLVATGAAPDGYGIQAFGEKLLERSGKHVSWSPRGGVQYEWLPGRLRVRGGTYWEPGRFEGVDGRLHATFGLEVRVLEFHAWGLRRGAITLTADAASSYSNAGLSLGFWH
ncbi:MAG TPA: hypothetical protein VGF94_10070 [Kofleriaceae bacterium]